MISYQQQKHEAIIVLHEAHRGSVLDLQATLRHEVPRLVRELDLDDGSSQSAKEWIEDSGSMFRMLKKHHFDIAGTGSALKQTLQWRISVLGSLQGNTATGAAPFIECLPRNVRDKFGRPVLRIQLARLAGTSEASKREILVAYEAMRKRLSSSQGCESTFQCVMMVDCQAASMRSMAVELIPWFIREVAPRFPGMCAAVFMINYSWAYSGMYNIVKRLLPSGVLARISFPSHSQLLLYFDRDRLPREYGGDLDISTESMSSRTYYDTLTELDTVHVSPHQDSHLYPPHLNTRLSSYLPSMSLLNPHFGYPALSTPGSSVPYLKNGRRRKRDLAGTLASLWLAKLKKTADKTWLWIIMTLILWVAELRR